MENELNNTDILEWLKDADEIIEIICRQKNIKDLDAYRSSLYSRSININDKIIVCMIKLKSSDAILVIGKCEYFQGSVFNNKIAHLTFCPLTHQNATILRKLFPFSAPSPLKDKDLTFGVGDRLGIATPGHIRLFNQYEAFPIFAQQSLRELNLTGRTYEKAVDCATFAVFREGFKRRWGADGDHLKTVTSIKNALVDGCTMITADVSDYIQNEYQNMDNDGILTQYKQLPEQYRKEIEKDYLHKNFELDTGEVISLSPDDLFRITLIYKSAIEYTKLLYDACIHIKSDADFELSIDETTMPTSPQAHIFIAKECLKIGVLFSSLAPKFIGEFQKGIDYIGDITAFNKAFMTHASIARFFGYRISVHSGSDKFSIFPIVGHETRGRFHIKTSGTNWLCALKIIAVKAPDLFRNIFKKSVVTFEKSAMHYHVTPDMSSLMPINEMSDAQLVKILDKIDDRRVLHIAYGEILKDKMLSEDLRNTLNTYILDYYDVLEEHIGKHLETLRVKKRSS